MDVKQRLLGRMKGIAIYLVNGERIRDEIDVDFVNGGNEAVYPSYVPAGEIWIDDAQHALDRTATALHELIERNLMLHNGMSYNRAHDTANIYEREFRKQLVYKPPKTFDMRRLTDAYYDYLRDPLDRKTPHQLEREIAQVLLKRNKAH